MISWRGIKKFAGWLHSCKNQGYILILLNTTEPTGGFKNIWQQFRTIFLDFKYLSLEIIEELTTLYCTYVLIFIIVFFLCDTKKDCIWMHSWGRGDMEMLKEQCRARGTERNKVRSYLSNIKQKTWHVSHVSHILLH